MLLITSKSKLIASGIASSEYNLIFCISLRPFRGNCTESKRIIITANILLLLLRPIASNGVPTIKTVTTNQNIDTRCISVGADTVDVKDVVVIAGDSHCATDFYCRNEFFHTKFRILPQQLSACQDDGDDDDSSDHSIFVPNIFGISEPQQRHFDVNQKLHFFLPFPM